MSAGKYILTWEQKEQIDLLLALSNGVSMALRSPGGRTHSWTLVKIGHLYEQQCKVEKILESLTTAPQPVASTVDLEAVARLVTTLAEKLRQRLPQCGRQDMSNRDRDLIDYIDQAVPEALTTLRSTVTPAPVQPSAVVSLEGVATWDKEEIRRAYSYQEVEEDEKWVRVSDLLRLVAPVQSVSVDLVDVIETSRMVQIDINGRTAMYWDDWVDHLHDAFEDELTTTQSAPIAKVFVKDEPDGTGHYENEQHEVAKCPHGCATLPISPRNSRPSFVVPSALDIAKVCLANYGTEPGNWMDSVGFEECAYETAQAIHAHLLSSGARESVAWEALEFYAKESNYMSPSTGFVLQYDPEPAPIGKDRGDIARTALATRKEPQ